MKWYWVAWSIVMFMCVLTQISMLSEIRDHLQVLRMFSGGWTTTDEEIMKRGEG